MESTPFAWKIIFLFYLFLKRFIFIEFNIHLNNKSRKAALTLNRVDIRANRNLKLQYKANDLSNKFSAFLVPSLSLKPTEHTKIKKNASTISAKSRHFEYDSNIFIRTIHKSAINRRSKINIQNNFRTYGSTITEFLFYIFLFLICTPHKT